jgi:RluA family pseudouridine synthase
MKKLSLKTTAEHAGKRLDQALAEWLPTALGRPVSKGLVRKLIMAGAVYLNGKRVRIASKELIPNARIEAYVDLAKLAQGGPSKDVAFKMTDAQILYEDDWLIAVNKPPGLPTQPTLDEARDNLYAAVKKFMAARGEDYIGLHHRLDRDTSGVVLFTKRKEANAGVSGLFTEHRARKTYQALTKKKAAPDHWTVKNYLAREPGKKSRFRSVRSGGDFAETSFRVLERLDDALWVEAQPKTGRTHQIRVHLSEGDLAILGDETYGGARSGVPRLMLHAVILTFPHPITNTETQVQAPLPEDFIQCLNRLRRG